MLLFSQKDGYNTSKTLIHYATPWDNGVMSRDAEIFFYGKNPEYVVDIQTTTNVKDLEISIYPHNHKDIMGLCTKKEDAVMELFRLAREKFPARIAFTIDVDTMKIIEDEDFTCYRPSRTFKHNYFTFQGRNGTSTFPITYMICNQNQNGNYSFVFETQAFTSHYCLKAANLHTGFGKNLTYILANSVERKKFIGDNKIPTIQGMQFPTNGRDRIPSFLRTDSFRKFMEKCKADDVKVTEKGIKLLPGPSTEEVVEADVLENLQYVLSKDEVDNVQARALRIQKQVLDKNSISITDLMSHGIQQIFKDIPVQNGIISVEMDVAGIARKMCLFQGKAYVIPVMKETAWEFYFGADPDSFVECTEETFPVGF